MPSEVLNIPQQVFSRIDREVGARIARMGCTSTAAALIKEDDSVSVRIEKTARSGGTSGTRTTVQDDGGLPLWISTDLPVDAIPVADVEQPVVVRFDFRIPGQLHCPLFRILVRHAPP